MTSDNSEFVDFFSKQMKTVNPDGSIVDMKEALIQNQKQFFAVERMPSYDPLGSIKDLPKIDFSGVKTNLTETNTYCKAQFDMKQAAVMKTMFELSIKSDGKVANDFMLTWI